MSRPLVLTLLAFGLLGSGSRAAERYACEFSPGGWQAADWILVKSPRWDRLGGWVQESDAIRNQVPEEATAAAWQGARAGETYTSMVLAKPFEGNLTVTTRFAFDHEMAPLVVLAPELGQDAQGRPEYREHFEVVAYNQGINVWHHAWADGKPTWRKTAYWKFELRPKTVYTLDVQVNHGTRGPFLVVRVDGREMGYLEPRLPAQAYVGITGCEGINRFYSLTVRAD